MYQNYNYYPQQQPTAPTVPAYQQQYYRSVQSQSPLLKGRQVSSLEEARATSIDFDGSVFYFPDLANKRIYTKQINIDGTASLNMYELKALPVVNEQQVPASMNFVTREEFEQAIAQLRSTVATPVDTIVEQPIPQEPVAKSEIIRQF